MASAKVSSLAKWGALSLTVNVASCFLSFLLIYLKKFYRSVIDLQCCVSFRCTAK